jgi:hypothetical protein
VSVLRLSVIGLYELIGLQGSLRVKITIKFETTTLINTMRVIGLSGTCGNHVGAARAFRWFRVHEMQL